MSAFFAVVSLSLGLATGAVAADKKEGVVLFGNDGRVFVAGPRDRSLKPLADADLDALAGRTDHVRTVGADTRVDASGHVAIRLHDSEDDFVVLEALEPAKRGQYVTAHRDANGDLYVELDEAQNGGGFVFFRAGEKPLVVSPSAQEWAGPGDSTAKPKFSSLVANPKGAGFVAVLKGELVHVLPPARSTRAFQVTRLGVADVRKVLLAGDEVFVFHKDGTLTRVKQTGGAWTTVAIAAPEGAPAFDSALSTSNGNPAQVVRALRNPVKVPAVVVDSTLPDGQRIEWRNGKEVKVDRDGTLIQPPKGSLDEVFAANADLAPLRRAISRNVTDRFAYDQYLGRERVYDESRVPKMTEMLEILIAPENNSPVAVGDAGVGKTALVEMLAQYAFLGRLPKALRFEVDLHNMVMVETSAPLISLLAKSNDASSQALAVAQFDEMARVAQKELGRPLVVFIDEMHMLSEAQRNAFKPLLAREAGGVRYVFGTNPDRYRLMVRYDQATERRTPAVLIEEMDVPTTRKLLTNGLVPRLARYFAGKDGNPATITADAVEQILRRAREYEPNTAFPAGPIVLANHVTAHAHRLAEEKAPVVDGAFVSRFVKEKMGLKFDPASPAFVQEIEAVRQRLKDKVVDQGELIDKVVDLFEDVVDDETGRPHRFLLVSGSTGVGKSFGAEEAGAELVGKSRVLTIDCTQFAGAGNNIELILNKLLGAPPGVLSSDEFIGILPEFLSGRGRGVNFIVWDEVDKMDPQAFKKLMEMFDKGVITGGDGKQYRLGRSVNVMTTNKGASHIQPRGRAGRAISREELEKRLKSFSADDIKKWFLEPNENDLYDKSMVLPPEVVQRIHDAIGMLPPTPKGAEYILQQVAKATGDVVKETKGYNITVDDLVITELVKARYSPENGLREPKRQLVEAMNSARRLLRRKTNGAIPAGAEIKLRLVKGQRGEAPVIEADLHVDGAVTHTVTTTGVNLRSVVDVMRDPVKRKVLQDLVPLLQQYVFGQDAMLKIVAQLVRNQWANPAIKDPVSALLLGPTGTGKTELAKALAKVLFGSEDRALLLPMGGVDHPFDLDEIFNPPKGVKGSEGLNRFEAFLRANRGIGGVVALDEIGNMGGGDPKEKAKLLKKFYEMLDEGTYTNKVTGETYDLREFIFILTSNEGQEEFAGVPADDMRNAIYEEMSDEDKLAEMLIKSHGWPPALVARVNALALARPLDKTTRARIAKKFLQETHQAIAEVSGIVAFDASDEFYETFGETFFTHERGARQMRVMIMKKDVADLVTQARLMLDPDDVEGSKFEFTLVDTYKGRYRFVGPLPDERVVEVKLKVVKDGRTLGEYSSGNIASRAAPRILQSEVDIDRTAAHEAGHAVANVPSDTGQRLEFITVQGEGTALGYARYKSLKTKYSKTRDEAVSRIAYILAGNVGQMLKGHPRDSGWTKDLEMARKEAERAVAVYGLSDETLNLPTEDGKVKVSDRVVQKEIAKLMAEGARMAQRRLEQRKAMFDAVYERLKAKETITAAEFDALERELEGKVSTGADDATDPGAGTAALDCALELVGSTGG